MKLTRQHALGALITAVLLAGVAWVALNSDWVEVQVPNPLKDEVLRDPDYRLKQFAKRLGVEVTAPDNLDRLPPPGATLALGSTDWNIFPERAQALRRWVEAGGHLWLPYQRGGDDALPWIPAKLMRVTRPKAPASAPTAAPVPAPAPTPASGADDDEDEDEEPAPPPQPVASRCPGVGEPDHVAPAFGAHRMFASCLYASETLRTTGPVEWALYGQHGQVVARMPVGRGSVTVASAFMPWSNDQLLESDNALLAAATLRLHAGQQLWIVTDEARPQLLSFLWARGMPAVLLAALALAIALWRGAVRFGPRAAPLPSARRSIAEQIRGTADFVAHHGGAALHAAQLRALNEAARPRVQGFDELILGERAQAIAATTRLDAHALARAMNPELDPAIARHPRAALTLLETARRRLLNNSPARQDAP